MIEVYQTKFGQPGGNCLQACIASILELKLDDVPDFCNQKPYQNWFGRFCEWLYTQGLGAAYTVTSSLGLSAAIPGYCILGMKTAANRGSQLGYWTPWTHAVVGEVVVDDSPGAEVGKVDFGVIFDPHPESQEIIEVLDATWIVRNAV